MIELTTRIYLCEPTYLVTEADEYLLTENGEYLLADGMDFDNPILNTDVLNDPGPSWEYGLGSGPLYLVAGTGILTFTLRNGANNSAGLEGLYSPGHPNCLSDFDKGMYVMLEVYNGELASSATRFVGTIYAIRPKAGSYRERSVEVEVHDWMEFASQKIGILAIATSKRADEALTLALNNILIKPKATSFAAGVETFATIFDTDDAKMSMASLMQKLCRNEGGGRVFLEGDGTLRFESRSFRQTDATTAFALDNAMGELDIEWSAAKAINKVNAKNYPQKTDTSAVVLYKLQKTFPISAGATVVIKAEFRDPLTGQKCSGTGIEPLVGGTHIKFGSVDDGSTNDLIGNLTFPQDIGGFQETVTLTNGGGVPGYLNFLEIKGLGIYTYDPLTSTEQDDASVNTIGEQNLDIDLEQIANPNTAHSMAVVYLSRNLEGLTIDTLRFLCNRNSELAAIALTLEPSNRFLLRESMTGIDGGYCVDHIRFEQAGPALWCEVGATKSPSIGNLFIWDTPDPTNHGWDVGVWSF